MLLKISFIIVAYIMGSIPTSYILGKKFKGIDIRNFGSGNVGATNALRILGTKYGVISMILDMAKGAIPVFAAKFLGYSDIWLILIALTAILGHIFTIFLKFKGGKGVATSAGVFIALAPSAIGIALLVFIIVVWISKYVSLGSILAASTLFAVELIINIRNGFQQKEILTLITIVALFIIIKHKANIKRLIAGNENKISFKK
ncbi:MAG: glycerol-3-phosphate 1-O-acyltransferase PlsY [Candidatus Cloacimonetes bacterium]|nr:glycerol-3-phosphate 1-O-acyltransferase PlsY [Candidatus Cloacimonadota bacterium]